MESNWLTIIAGYVRVAPADFSHIVRAFGTLNKDNLDTTRIIVNMLFLDNDVHNDFLEMKREVQNSNDNLFSIHNAQHAHHMQTLATLQNAWREIYNQIERESERGITSYNQKLINLITAINSNIEQTLQMTQALFASGPKLTLKL